jgi:outer membrane receptor protein involved in Fe transport
LYYASVNRGYKTGGINTAGSLSDDLRQFEPEYVMNYELGYKVSFLQNQAYLRTAVFYMNRDDVQINTSVVDIRENNSTEFISYIDNAISGTNKGIEVDGAWQINDRVELYGALGLLDTEFSGYINPEGDSLSGRDQAHAPQYQFNIGLNYQPSNEWLINVSYDGKDEFYFSDSHNEKSQPVELLNASVSYLADNWQVKVWARNMLDEDYATRGFYFGNDPRDGYSAKSYYQYGEPVVFGATLDYQF